jgi:hypothetical protein
MKKLYFLDEEEKQRILNIHESATKRQYLSEQSNQFLFSNPKDPLNIKQNSMVLPGDPGDPYQYMKFADQIWYAKKSEGKNPKWVEVKNEKAKKAVKSKIFQINYNSTPPSTKTDKQTKKVKTDNTEKLKKKIGEFSTRTQEQLKSMQSKEQLKNDSFIIVNKSAAMASLFGPNYKFITNSSITSGEVKDSGVDKKPDNSQKNWLKISLDYAKKNPNSKDGVKIKNWLTKYKDKIGLVNNDGTVNWLTYLSLAGTKSVDLFPFSYTARSESGGNITPSGTFAISSGENEPGYAGGEKGNKNSFPLIDPDFVGEITPAIHGYASDKRGQLINKAAGQGFDVNKDYTRAGAGCINVTPDFLIKMKESNPSYVIILPDTGGVVDIKITTFQNFKVKLTQLGSKCIRSISSLFS